MDVQWRSWAIVESPHAERFRRTIEPALSRQVPLRDRRDGERFRASWRGDQCRHNPPLTATARSTAGTRGLNAGAAAPFVPEVELETRSPSWRITAEPALARKRAPHGSDAIQVLICRCRPGSYQGIWQRHVFTDRWFVKLAQANPQLRVRISNPDELASNKMGPHWHSFEAPRQNDARTWRPGIDATARSSPHSNEEAVAAAALANKGLNRSSADTGLRGQDVD